MFARKKHTTQSISVETDISGPLRYLEGLGADRHKAMRRILSGIGTAAKNQVRKAYKGYGLSKGKGDLYKSITRKVLRSGKGVIVEAKAKTEKDKVFYGYALAKGAQITAKAGDYLTFQKDGKWMRVHSVKLPERDFVVKPVEKYLQSSAFSLKLDHLVQKELERIEKETGK
ncbi:MAG: hypothetical protein WCS07_08590 [Sphaerochaeta sp.]